jgi:hypothetical protein
MPDNERPQERILFVRLWVRPMKCLLIPASVVFATALLPSCFAQAISTPATSSKNDTTIQKQDKKSAKAKAKTYHPASKVTTTPSQDAAYAQASRDGAPKQSSPK